MSYSNNFTQQHMQSPHNQQIRLMPIIKNRIRNSAKDFATGIYSPFNAGVQNMSKSQRLGVAIASLGSPMTSVAHLASGVTNAFKRKTPTNATKNSLMRVTGRTAGKFVRNFGEGAFLGRKATKEIEKGSIARQLGYIVRSPIKQTIKGLRATGSILRQPAPYLLPAGGKKKRSAKKCRGKR